MPWSRTFGNRGIIRTQLRAVIPVSVTGRRIDGWRRNIRRRRRIVPVIIEVVVAIVRRRHEHG